jgi:hypothetical protein
MTEYREEKNAISSVRSDIGVNSVHAYGLVYLASITPVISRHFCTNIHPAGTASRLRSRALAKKGAASFQDPTFES